MIIHSFLTDGLLDWGILFLESFKKYHGDKDIKIKLDTRNLEQSQINRLKKVYYNLEVRNKKMDIGEVAERCGTTEKKMNNYKGQVEKKSVTKQNKVWKQFISVEERYRNSIWKVFQEYKDTEDFMIHMDIDIYFRGHIQRVIDLVKENDITIRFRNKAIRNNKKHRCVLGNLIGMQFNDRVENFLKTWHKIINEISLKNKPKGYGQISFWKAYLKHTKDIKWGNLSETVKFKAPNALIWSANRGDKNECLKKCWDEFYSKNGQDE